MHGRIHWELEYITLCILFWFPIYSVLQHSYHCGTIKHALVQMGCHLACDRLSISILKFILAICTRYAQIKHESNRCTCLATKLVSSLFSRVHLYVNMSILQGSSQSCSQPFFRPSRQFFLVFFCPSGERFAPHPRSRKAMKPHIMTNRSQGFVHR